MTDRNYRNVHGKAVAGVIILIVGMFIFTDRRSSNELSTLGFGIVCSIILVDLIWISAIKRLNDHRKDSQEVITLGDDLNFILRSCAD